MRNRFVDKFDVGNLVARLVQLHADRLGYGRDLRDRRGEGLLS